MNFSGLVGKDDVLDDLDDKDSNEKTVTDKGSPKTSFFKEVLKTKSLV